MYFVANEWIKLSTKRKCSNGIQILMVLLTIIVIIVILHRIILSTVDNVHQLFSAVSF